MNNQLHTACQKGKIKKVKELLNDKNITSFINVGAGVFGYTPLHEATSSGKAEIIELLILSGAEVNTTSNGRYTPLHIAATIGDLRCIEVLLKNNAKVMLTDEFGKTPHKTAELNKQRQAARLLKTAELKNAIKDRKPTEFTKMVELLQPGVDVTLTCFNECLELAVELNYHFAAGFIALREPDNMLDCLAKAFSSSESNETAAMLLACIAAIRGDSEMLDLLFCSNYTQDTDPEEKATLKRDYFPSKDLTGDKLIQLRNAVTVIDCAFPICLACNKKKHKALKYLLFNETYCSPIKKEIDWHGLALSTLKEDLIEDILDYKKLHLGYNQLSRLPANMEHFENLVRLELQHNALLSAPPFLFELPLLSNLNLSFNKISTLPFVERWSKSLNLVDLKGNLLTSFPKNIKRASVQFLNIAQNKFETFPIGVCSLTSLTTLDISMNRDIRELPVQLGNLSKLVDFTFTGLAIRDPPAHLQTSPKALISHLRARLKGAEPYYCMKLLIIGQADHGKTTLMHRLKGDLNFNGIISTQGIDIQEMRITRSFGQPFTFRVWDFAGQQDYHATHQCFLSQRSLYLLVWDTQELKGIEELKPWLDNLAARVPGATIIIVGTKLDEIPGGILKEQFEPHMHKRVVDLFKSETRFSKIKLAGVEFVSSNPQFKSYKERMENLKAKIYDVASEMRYTDRNGKDTDDRIMGEQIPKSYRLFEESIIARRKEKQKNSEIPILTHQEFLELARNLMANKANKFYEEDIPHITKFLHNIGTILHYNDPNYDLKDMYFINPSWLCRLMAKIITVEAVHNCIRNGILETGDLKDFIIREGVDFPPTFYNKYLRLLYRFQIACPIDAKRALVPSKLPNGSSGVKEPVDRNLLFRSHVFSCIPFGFWERFISRLLLFMKDMLAPSSSEEEGTFTIEDTPLFPLSPESYRDSSTSWISLSTKRNEPGDIDGDEDEDDEEGDRLNISINQPKGGVVFVSAASIPAATPPLQTYEGSSSRPFFQQRLVSVNGVELEVSSSMQSSAGSDASSSSVPSLGSIYPVSGSSTSQGGGTFSSFSGFSSGEPTTSSKSEEKREDNLSEESSSDDNGARFQPVRPFNGSSTTLANEEGVAVTLQSSISMLTVLEVEGSIGDHQRSNDAQEGQEESNNADGRNQTFGTTGKDHKPALVGFDSEDSSVIPSPSKAVDNREGNLTGNAIDVNQLEDEDEDEDEEEKRGKDTKLGFGISEEPISECKDDGGEVMDKFIESDKPIISSTSSGEESPRYVDDSACNSFKLDASDEDDNLKELEEAAGSTHRYDHPSSPTSVDSVFQSPGSKLSPPVFPSSAESPLQKKSSSPSSFNEFMDVAHLFDEGILKCWKTGITFKHPKLFFSVCKKRSSGSSSSADNPDNTVETKVSNNSVGHRVLGYILDHIRTLIKEWYPGLSGNDGEKPYVNQFAACPVCMRMGIRNPHMFSVREAFSKIYLSKEGDNCLRCGRLHNPQVVDVDVLCPELLFKDLSKDLQIPRSKLYFEESNDFLLGKGGFGMVYQGTLIKGRNESLIPVAIKLYNFGDSLNAQDVFHEIRQEIFILSKLRDHQFIIKFKGFVIEPRLCALMELANHGSLHDTLTKESGGLRGMHRVVLFRMIKQLTSAMSFMHHLRIIHRDIKSDNILVFSTDPGAEVLVKLTDFGTANFLTPDGMKNINGTPGYRAPEMFNFISTDEYTTKVDIYSFAMVVGELVTGRRPFHNLIHHQIPDALKCLERPQYTDVRGSLFGLLPLVDLMTKMWRQEITTRPNADQVLKQAQNHAFQLFYGKRTLEVPQNPIVLCAVPHSQEIWVVCDNIKGSFISILDMNKDAEVKLVIDIDGKASGMDSYNPTHIQLVNEDHLAIVVLGIADDDIRIFTTERKSPTHEKFEDDHIKSIAVHKGIVYVGLQSGYLARVSVKSFLKGKLQKEMTRVLVNENRPITSIVFSDKEVVVCSGGYLYQYPLEFPKEDEKKRHEVKIQQLHPYQRIAELLTLPRDNGSTATDTTYFAVQFDSLAEVHIVEFDTFRVVCKLDFKVKIRELKCSCEELDCRVTAMLTVYDVLWIGTGSGHVFIYDIGRLEDREPELLTVFQPYSTELRKLCLWQVPADNNIYSVEFIVASTGKLLNVDAFGTNAVCTLTSEFPPIDEKVKQKSGSSLSVTSFDDTLKAPEGKTILFWYAADARTMRSLLKET